MKSLLVHLGGLTFSGENKLQVPNKIARQIVVDAVLEYYKVGQVSQMKDATWLFLEKWNPKPLCKLVEVSIRSVSCTEAAIRAHTEASTQALILCMLIAADLRAFAEVKILGIKKDVDKYGSGFIDVTALGKDVVHFVEFKNKPVAFLDLPSHMNKYSIQEKIKYVANRSDEELLALKVTSILNTQIDASRCFMWCVL